MGTGAKILIGGTVAAAAAAAYYFLIYQKAQTKASIALSTISDSITANAIQPSQYEGKLIGSPDTGKVYLVQNGYKRWISSPDVLSRMGYSHNQVIDLPPPTVDAIPTGASFYGLNGISRSNFL